MRADKLCEILADLPGDTVVKIYSEEPVSHSVSVVETVTTTSLKRCDRPDGTSSHHKVVSVEVFLS
jgi:hypothetical protein